MSIIDIKRRVWKVPGCRPTEGSKPAHVHTLNASALALPRIVAALLENGQQADGSITLPAPLAERAGFGRIEGV